MPKLPLVKAATIQGVLTANQQAEKNLVEKIERLKKMSSDDPLTKAAIERAQLYLNQIREAPDAE